MELLLKKVEVTIKTPRSKEAVINSLEEIASFNGDNFKMPIRIFGNKLFVKRRNIVGTGVVTINNENTYVKVTLSASGQLRAALFFSILIFAIVFITAIVGFLWGDLGFLPFIGISALSFIFQFIPRIIYFFAVQLKKDSIENLVLHEDSPNRTLNT